jgi:hypothetical protein
MQYMTEQPREENKALLSRLREGMTDLEYLKENKNPNFEAQAVANLNQLRQSHMIPVMNNTSIQDSAMKASVLQPDATDGINYDTQSIQSAIHYNQSAIGEMNFDELNQLMNKNA